jgi:hypothetical protein
MKPQIIFKLAVRILGLLFLCYGLAQVPLLFGGIFGSASNATAFVISVVWPLLVGFCLLGFAPKFTEFFYPKSED